MPTPPSANVGPATAPTRSSTPPTAASRYTAGKGENVAGGPFGGFVPPNAPLSGYDTGNYDDGNYNG